jgi:hypothetical protein
MSTSDLRKELRELRKEHVKPVSRMKKGDISNEISKLREMRETVPAAAAVPSAPAKVLASRVETVKQAKAKEFPVAPAAPVKKAARFLKDESKPAPAAKVTKAQLLAMISSMED